MTLGRSKAEQAVLEYQGYLRIDSGTTWDDSTLLEELKETNLELERRDGIKRHFRYDWEEVARYNPDYLAYVEAERERLGENHPLFLTQYRLLPIRGSGGFLSTQQRAQLAGQHVRKHEPDPALTWPGRLRMLMEPI